MEQTLFVVVDLLGTVAFAISGATAATERRLDLFGVYAVAFLTACGGGIVRDVCLGALPPVAISDWRYLACAGFASTVTIGAGPWVERLKNPVAIFDSVGLGFFAVVGAHKAFLHAGHVESAIVLGIVSAVGGGVMRDVLLARVPVILAKEIYALAALVAAVIQVVAEVNGWFIGLASWFAIGACLVIRFLAIRYSWGLPVVGRPSPDAPSTTS
jgi:uncharacterized membrane protein YeiH